jgi:cation diffusion facilitator CzcD-associated flavoprotein CzcO
MSETTPVDVHVDVIVVGAGISGIGAAYHLTQQCPDRSFVMLEGRADIGGTWDLFRYPGVRSDSDMHTLGYSFKPWVDDKAIADGPRIMKYLRETVEEFDLEQYIRFNTRVERADWSSDEACWRLTARDTATDEPVTYSCSYLFMCSGYYSYQRGYLPEFPGYDRFQGTLVHPQEWPEDLDYQGKRVVVVGSGATAMTLVPAMARSGAGHVTMLQRSPTWVVSRPAEDAIANRLRRLLPGRLAYKLTRKKNVALQQFLYGKSRTEPDKVRERLLKMSREQLGDEMVDQHFTPSYDPWDQRLCLIPDGDLYDVLNDGSASVVTDTIETFTETGIQLTSGEHLDADIIVTATGLQLVTLGEIDFAIDGEPVDFANTYTYRGVSYSDVPNLASTFGYINASWTLRADLVSGWVCRVLNYMRATGTDVVVPRLRPEDAGMATRPWVEDFSSGYIQRMLPMLPKQGDHEPWVQYQHYGKDVKYLAESPLTDDALHFEKSRAAV